MKNIKKQLLAASLVASTMFTPAANAQWAVLDVANLGQAMTQVQAWTSQYKQMMQQYQQLQSQLQTADNTLANFKGSRGMSALAGDTGMRQALPADFMSNFDKLRSMGASGATSEAKAIYDKIKAYGCSQQLTNSAEIKNCEAIAMAAPTALAMIDNSINKAKQRQNVIQGLIAQVDGAPDAKAAADLGNRIQSELALLNNEKVMMDMALATQAQQLALSQQQQYETSVKRMKYGQGTNPFGGN